MRQILCNLASGEVVLAEVPAPAVQPGRILVQTTRTLVSQGTEKMLVEFGKASLLQKARSQPEKIRQVLQKIRSEGLFPSLEAVFRKLDEPLPLGYCNAGRVVAVGAGVTGFRVGDRVASNGPHAEIVDVPPNLCAPIPDQVCDDDAAFAVAGAIALQGIRLGGPTLGETVAVIGLGLLGQLAVQLLRAAGCNVLGYDFDTEKVRLAGTFGADCLVPGEGADPVAHAIAVTKGLGVDFVLITASSRSNDVISQAARMSRKRGRIVLVGVIGLELNRAEFYEKELTFQVSCSYGPGRYDPVYEGKGYDYPAAFVRWTENRNIRAVLDMTASGRLNLAPLITRRVPLDDFRLVYGDIGKAAGLASVLCFPEKVERVDTIRIASRKFEASGGALAIVGTGNFAKMSVLPALRTMRATAKYLVSVHGVSSTHLARKYGIPFSTSDLGPVLEDREVAGLIISTRHNLHAPQVIAGLKAAKHVLVEKPLCLNATELDAIAQTLQASRATLTVGFNRRFSPHTAKARALLGTSPGPVALVMTMNAGAVPANHWVHDPETGGGRLLGEACHFVDFAVHLTGSPVTAVCANLLGDGVPTADSAAILLRHQNGSSTTINYLATGSRDYPKERIEVFWQGRVLIIDDFKVTTGYGFRGFTRMSTSMDKGHAAQFAAFAAQLRSGGAPLIPWEEIANVTRASLAIDDSIRANTWVNLPTE